MYALEGSIAVAGAALSWLKDNLNIFDDFSEIGNLTDSKSASDIYFVPAFYGLYSPHWRTDACRLVENLLSCVVQLITYQYSTEVLFVYQFF